MFVGTISSFIFWRKIKISLRNSYILLSLTLLLPHLSFFFLPNLPEESNVPIYYFAIIALLLIITGINAGGYMMKLIPAVYLVTNS